MATKKNVKSNRQKATKSLPVSRSKKKPAAKTSKPKSVTKKVKQPIKKSPTARKPRTSSRKPKVEIKQYRLKVWKDTHFIFQLERTKKAPAKKSKKESKTSANLQKRLSAGLVVIGLIGTLYFATDIFKPAPNLTIYSPPVPAEISSTRPTELGPKTLPKSDPVKLLIPDIGINASLTTVGKNPDNTLEVPKNAMSPAWYRKSPTPGELGPAIIVGHVDSKTGPAIFWKLNQLAQGQIIEVARSDNTVAKFKVTAVKQFEQNNFPTEEVYGTIRHAGLRLITCGGVFNRTTQSYSHNTVVYAELIP